MDVQTWSWLLSISGISTEGLVYSDEATYNTARLAVPGSTKAQISWPIDTQFVVLKSDWSDENEFQQPASSEFTLRRPEDVEIWRLESFGLIGLWKTHPPGSKTHELQLPINGFERSLNRRDTNLIEEAAIETFDNNDLFASYEAGSPGIRFVTAIRAEQRCLNCHKVDVGDVLGAFTFLLLQSKENSVQRPTAQFRGGSGR